MSLRVKVLLLVIVLNIITILSVNLFGQKMLVTPIHQYKERQLDRRLKTIKKLVDEQINVIDNSVRDYAYWDDTYSFMTNFDPQYVESNLGRQTFANIEIDYMGFFDVHGTKYFSSGYKHDTGDKYDISPELSLKLEELSFSLYSENINAYGVITSGENIYYVASRPVLRSNKQGPAVGTLMMIREFDGEVKQKIDDLVQEPYELNIYKNVESTLSKSLNAMILDRSTVVDKTKNGMVGYALINGIDKEPSLIISMKEDSLLALLESYYIKYLNVFLLILFIINLILTLLFMDKLILGPLRLLVTEVDRIRTRKVSSQRITVKAQGEIQQLVTNINTMLDTLDNFDKKLVAVNKQMEEKTLALESNTKELERVNQHMVGRELRMAELKEQIEDLQFKLNENTDDIQQ